LQGCSRRYITEDEENKAVQSLSQAYKSENWQTRKDVLTRLCAYNSPDVENILISALSDTHPTVKIEALDCLAEKKYNNARRNIRDIAESEADANVRMAAIQALSGYRDPTFAPIFAKGLASDDWLIREESIRGLLMIEDIVIMRISVPYVLQALKDPRINVKLAVLQSLKVKNKVIYNELSAIINNDENYNKVNLLNAAVMILCVLPYSEGVNIALLALFKIGFLSNASLEISAEIELASFATP
jgi:HEAT repeat protein